MNNSRSKLKIAFCITCMNRLSHLQETLIKNIEDNNSPDEVEFILLDYNSSDGLDEWVKTLTPYLSSGILVYYRTDFPIHYDRSHSRNMAFRLSNADILCNLDADNYLGKGFANYVIDVFKTNSENKIFITSDFSCRDIFGRICILKNDFQKVRGYNEILIGYGAEDIDIYYRLIRLGYEQIVFNRKEFCNVIHHSDKERISQEKKFLSLNNVYIKHRTPYSTDFIIFYNDNKCELGTLTNNFLCNFNIDKNFSNSIEMFWDERFRVTLDSSQIGMWKLSSTNKDENIIYVGNKHFNINFKLDQFKFENTIFSKIKDEKIITKFIVDLSDALNFNLIKSKTENKKEIINPLGFGKGIVYRNFENKKIILK